jgi:hypothetical protein
MRGGGNRDRVHRRISMRTDQMYHVVQFLARECSATSLGAA